jgi:hypothetical protein
VSPTEADSRALLARRLSTQSRSCAELGSDLYGWLLSSAAQDVIEGGVVRSVLAGREADPGPSALALRLLGAVHRLVLTGRAPRLAAWYPSAGGVVPDSTGSRAQAWAAFVSTLEEHRDEVVERLDRPVQTNEVLRCAGLLGAFLVVAGATGLPLRMLEVGASAGLNLRFDHYLYRSGQKSWGPPGSPVDLGDPYRGAPPPFGTRLEVVERRGCDLAPVDPTDADGAMTLLSFVWPDMPERRARLLGAIEVAHRVPVVIDQVGAADWVTEQLSATGQGVATVVYHSVVMQYIEPAERERFVAVLRAAGDAASPSAPLAWVRSEPARHLMEVKMTLWPPGEESHVADAGPHGTPVDWFGVG